MPRSLMCLSVAVFVAFALCACGDADPVAYTDADAQCGDAADDARLDDEYEAPETDACPPLRLEIERWSDSGDVLHLGLGMSVVVRAAAANGEDVWTPLTGFEVDDTDVVEAVRLLDYGVRVTGVGEGFATLEVSTCRGVLRLQIEVSRALAWESTMLQWSNSGPPWGGLARLDTLEGTVPLERVRRLGVGDDTRASFELRPVDALGRRVIGTPDSPTRAWQELVTSGGGPVRFNVPTASGGTLDVPAAPNSEDIMSTLWVASGADIDRIVVYGPGGRHVATSPSDVLIDASIRGFPVAQLVELDPIGVALRDAVGLPLVGLSSYMEWDLEQVEFEAPIRRPNALDVGAFTPAGGVYLAVDSWDEGVDATQDPTLVAGIRFQTWTGSDNLYTVRWGHASQVFDVRPITMTDDEYEAWQQYFGDETEPP